MRSPMLLFHADFGYGKANKWEINEGLQALLHLDALVAALEPYETPATVVGPGPDGSQVEINEGLFLREFIFPWVYSILMPGVLQTGHTPSC